MLGVDFLIFVILGTQDKEFTRLLRKIQKLIDKGIITEKVVVQAGSTNFKSNDMIIKNYMSMKEFGETIKESDYIITHGGVGSIIDSLKKEKKVIAVARQKKYNEHENDHQLEIIDEFTKMGYILGCAEVSELETRINKIPEFVPNKYKSNNKKIINNLERYIDNL